MMTNKSSVDFQKIIIIIWRVLANSSSLALGYLMLSSFGVSLLFGTVAAVNIGNNNIQVVGTAAMISSMGWLSSCLICFCGHSLEKKVLN